MAAIVCELCGSNDVVKKGGNYVCQHCGTKYTLEEAKKLLGTVKVDRGEELEKLLVLARRARDENNSENAAKYYDLVLQEDPNNWEAAFFQVYFQAAQCKIMNISSAASSVANSVTSTLKLISGLEEDNEQIKALIMVILYAGNIAEMLANAANRHYTQYSNVNNAWWEYGTRVHAAKGIYENLESGIKTNFADRLTELVSVQKSYISFLSKYANCFVQEYLDKESTRLSSEIKANDPSYEPPVVKRKTGCYVATAVYGSYDCPEVWTLRRYRDNILAKSWYGRAFIHTYYAISPMLVKWFGEAHWFKNMWKPKLDRMVVRLHADGVEDTPYQDKNW